MNKITFSATWTALFFTIFVVLLSESAIIYADPYSMYGENDTYLGQIVDNYFNDDNVNFTSNVVHDNVSNLMKLEYHDALLQNLSIYTEVDSANDITVYDYDVIWSSMQRNAESWLVFDFGASYFLDYEINFTLYFSNVEAGDDSGRDIMAVMMLSNSIGTYADVIGGDYMCVLPRQVGLTDNLFRYVLRQAEGGVDKIYIVDDTNYVMSTNYYCTLERDGTNVSLSVYTNELRTNRVELLSGIGAINGYRYLHVIASYDSPTGDPNDHSTGTIYDVTFSGGYFDGYFIMNDILEGDRALNLLYNVTILGNTGITIEFYNGTDYVDHNNVSGYESLTDGFEAIDLRDLNISILPIRVNMTTNDVSKTPYFSQLRYVTIIGEVEIGGIDLTPSIIVALFLILVGSGLIYGVKKRR